MPMIRQHTPAAAAVQATALFLSSPAAERISGLTNRMYAIVRNVATAPRTSRATVTRRSAAGAARSADGDR